jgi:hypothetical protein
MVHLDIMATKRWPRYMVLIEHEHEHKHKSSSHHRASYRFVDLVTARGTGGEKNM